MRTSLPAKEHWFGSPDLKTGLLLSLQFQIRTVWTQAGGLGLVYGTEAAVEAWNHFVVCQLHCSIKVKRHSVRLS